MKGPVTTFISIGEIRTPGMRTMSALLRGRGWKTNLVIYKAAAYFETDLPTKKEEDLLIELLKDLNTDIVGLYVIAPFYRSARMLTERIKREVGAMVVWGGTYPTILPEECIDHADILCRGEGERSIVELVDSVEKQHPTDTIQNLWLKTGQGVVRNKIRPLLQREDLDALPFPDCGGDNKYLIDGERIMQDDPLNRTIEYYAFASRGCPFHCNFCVNSVLGEVYRGAGPYVRVKSPEYVVSEIAHMLETLPSIRRIRFEDEIFPWKIDWIERFCEEYSKKVRLPFLFASHPNMITEDAIRMLKAAGLIVVGFGVQSPCQRVRKEVLTRTETDQKILECIGILQRNKVECCFDVIFDNPFENEQDRMNGFEFLTKIPKPFIVTAFSLKFFPGHGITKDALSRGLLDVSEVEKISSKGWVRSNYDWKANRSAKDVYWNSLYMLASRSVVPSGFVRSLSKLEWLKRHPNVLVRLARWSWRIELFAIGIRRLKNGQVKLGNFLKVIFSEVMRRTAVVR